MSKKLMEGVWIMICDWKDPVTGNSCALGLEGEPAMFVDPDQGRDPGLNFECGRHHGVVPQAERPEFQLPEDHVLNETVFSNDENLKEGDGPDGL